MGFQIKCIPVMAEMPRCCCSCSLRTATIILGWLGLILQVLEVVRSAVRLAYFDEKIEDLQPHESRELIAVSLAASAVGGIIVALLLYGAHKERPAFMMPYVVLGLIGLVIIAVVVVVFGIISLMADVYFGLGFLLGGILFIVLNFTCWRIIYSYYRQLEERQHLFPSPDAPSPTPDNYVADGTSGRDQKYGFVYHDQSGGKVAA